MLVSELRFSASKQTQLDRIGSTGDNCLECRYEMPSENGVWKHTKLRSSKYLNNLIEQDHRGIKSRTGPMLGFKRFDYAAITIAGIELLHRIHKGQFALGYLRLKDQAAPDIWNAVLAA